MITIKKIEQICPELSLYHYNQIPVLAIDHPIGKAKIALQGAQLLSWQPTDQPNDLLWLSEIEPFQIGSAIRGGVPICYPWFGNEKQPAHGTARLRLWQLSDYQITPQQIQLNFALYDQQQIEAQISFIFDQQCQIQFTHLGNEPAQLALHSYFNVSEISQVEVTQLPPNYLNKLTQQQEIEPPTARRIDRHLDQIYHGEIHQNSLLDHGFHRQICLTHQNASEVVLWNPWTTPTSAISPLGYQTMLCLETARLSQPLYYGEKVGVIIDIEPM